MTNQEVYFAEQFALNTSQSFYLTGKAGTGKTTLLKKILTQTDKNTIVVAPTGVAAINAGGVTIHSMFGLPLTSFVPNNDFVDLNVANNRYSLSKHLRYRKEKRKLIQELDLLIIDEISMVRADLLDAIDFVLQHIRHSKEPFGGVQVLFIGDLYQLPPVVRPEQWSLLENYYQSPFFFDSIAWQNLNAFTIELKHIYRQQDEAFISILNNVRNNTTTNEDLDTLNQHYDSTVSGTLKNYITLCTHNYQADSINKKELNKIADKSFVYKAEIEGTFNENAYPADLDIELKVGAQIMFIRNDAEENIYYNGKLAEVIYLGASIIKVKFLDTEEEYTLKKEEWENINYTINKETNEVKQEKLGSFQQYPIRLAWAITIHKSQGLTFEKAIVDVEKSFAAGQAYVALSRCTDLEGLILKSKIQKSNVIVDSRIVVFHKNSVAHSNLDKALEYAKEDYAQKLIFKAFTFANFKDEIADWKDIIEKKDLPGKADCMLLQKEAHSTWLSIQDVEHKFKQQLQKIFNKPYNEREKHLKERCGKAIEYFTEETFNKLIVPLNKHINEYSYKSRTKAYLNFCRDLLQMYWLKMKALYGLHYVDVKLYQAENVRNASQLPGDNKPVAKAKKGATYEITLTMFKEGLNVQEIAEKRSMAESTIAQHLTKWIKKGEISIFDVVEKQRVETLLPYYKNNEFVSLTQLKDEIPFETTYIELRYTLAHYENINKK
ncbi:MAG: AAA family ATPase [Chitinophagales bacterium]|nr:AAA family ATPase [Chitinophagales bacterium]